MAPESLQQKWRLSSPRITIQPHKSNPLSPLFTDLFTFFTYVDNKSYLIYYSINFLMILLSFFPRIRFTFQIVIEKFPFIAEKTS